MAQKCFWLSWVVTLTTTGLLLLWSLPLAPFTTPGMRANEAVIVFFPVMFGRWLALATLLYQVTAQWSAYLQLNAQWSAVSTVAVLLLHVLLGLINLGVLNLWLSVSEGKTRTVALVCVVVSFDLPLSVLALCPAVQLVFIHQSR